ncbi:MAG TPA: hypothetical protein DCM40_34875 [Maribacter sp.]|nr:hypothetical protein [Maribacter sp.]
MKLTRKQLLQLIEESLNENTLLKENILNNPQAFGNSEFYSHLKDFVDGKRNVLPHFYPFLVSFGRGELTVNPEKNNVYFNFRNQLKQSNYGDLLRSSNVDKILSAQDSKSGISPTYSGYDWREYRILKGKNPRQSKRVSFKYYVTWDISETEFSKMNTTKIENYITFHPLIASKIIKQLQKRISEFNSEVKMKYAANISFMINRIDNFVIYFYNTADGKIIKQELEKMIPQINNYLKQHGLGKLLTADERSINYFKSSFGFDPKELDIGGESYDTSHTDLIAKRLEASIPHNIGSFTALAVPGDPSRGIPGDPSRGRIIDHPHLTASLLKQLIQATYKKYSYKYSHQFLK